MIPTPEQRSSPFPLLESSGRHAWVVVLIPDAAKLGHAFAVMPPEAGIQQGFEAVDSRVRWNDKLVEGDSI
jgi:hypothetical protein